MKAGQRCRFSQHGKETFPQTDTTRLGTNLKIKSNGLSLVHWDGRKTEQQLHPSFIEVIEDDLINELSK